MKRTLKLTDTAVLFEVDSLDRHCGSCSFRASGWCNLFGVGLTWGGTDRYRHTRCLTAEKRARDAPAHDDTKPAGTWAGYTGLKCPDCDQSGRHFCEGRRQVVETPGNTGPDVAREALASARLDGETHCIDETEP